MTYTKQTWKNLPDQTTPVSAARLNHLETQFDEAAAYTDQQIAANPGSEGPRGPEGPEGPQGPPGEDGTPGAPGVAATISGATASPLPPGATPTVTAGGTPNNRTFEFGIPQGAPGERGADGTSVTIKGTLPGVGSLPEMGQLGDAWMIAGNLWVWTGDDWENVGPIQGPKGDPGTNGSSATIESATATGLPAGTQPSVTLGGTPSARTMAFGIPKGDAGAPGSDGADGASGTITSTTAETISYGVAPSVILGGTPTARTMKFMIPEGSPGEAGKISTATASGLPAGSQPTITLGGSPYSRTMAFGIPAGDKGDKGDQGNPTTVNGKTGASITLTAADLGAASERETPRSIAPGLNGVPADGTGDAGPPLTALLSSLPSGSVVEARPGDVYNLHTGVTVSKPVTIRGGTWLHRPETASFRVTASDVTLENLRVVGPELTSSHPASSRFVLASGSQALPIERLSITGGSFTNCSHTALRLDWCKDLNVSSNHIQNVHYAGIMMDSANRGTVSDNIIRNVVQGGTLINSYGIAVSDSGNVESARSRDVIVKGNFIDGVLKWEGIDTHGGSGILVLGNTLRSCRYPISIVVGNPTRALAPQGCIVSDNVIVRGDAPDEARAISFVGLNANLLSDGIIGVNTIRGYSQDLHLNFNDPSTMVVLPQSTDAAVRISPAPSPFRSWARIIEMSIPANSSTATSRAVPLPPGYFTQVPALLASASTNTPNKLSVFTSNASPSGFTLGCVVTDGTTTTSPRTIQVSVAAFQMDSGAGLTPGV